MEKKLADKIKAEFWKNYSFDQLVKYVSDYVYDVYSKEAGSTGWPGFVVRFENIPKPYKSHSSVVDAVRVIHWPVSREYGGEEVSKWFEEQGFVWAGSNGEYGWRITS